MSQLGPYIVLMMATVALCMCSCFFSFVFISRILQNQLHSIYRHHDDQEDCENGRRQPPPPPRFTPCWASYLKYGVLTNQNSVSSPPAGNSKRAAKRRSKRSTRKNSKRVLFRSTLNKGRVSSAPSLCVIVEEAELKPETTQDTGFECLETALSVNVGCGPPAL